MIQGVSESCRCEHKYPTSSIFALLKVFLEWCLFWTASNILIEKHPALFRTLKSVFWQPFKILTGIQMVQPIPDWCSPGQTNRMTYTIQNKLSAFWVSGIWIPTANFIFFRSLNLCVLVVLLNSIKRSYILSFVIDNHRLFLWNFTYRIYSRISRPRISRPRISRIVFLELHIGPKLETGV